MKENTAQRLAQIMNERNLRQVDILKQSEKFQKEIKELQIERDTLKKHRDKIVKDYDFAKEMKEEHEKAKYKNSNKFKI